MKVSVIIPTYNGANKILGAIRSLEKQVVMPDEIIVVVDGSTDGTTDLLRNTKINLPSFRIVEQANSGRARVRNLGAAEAKGDLLIFLDDDMIVPRHWVASHIEHHSIVQNSLLSGKLEAATENQKGEFIVFEKWQNKKWNSGISQNTNDSTILQNPYIAACNFSIRKNLFFDLGEFDPRLNDAEDYDLAVRALKENHLIYFSPKAYAFHYDEGLKDFKSYIRRLRQYRKAHEQLVRFNPGLHGNESLNDRFPSKPTGIKYMIFNFFAKSYWIDMMDRGQFKWLPKAIRCKLYDIIVTANGVYFIEKATL